MALAAMPKAARYLPTRRNYPIRHSGRLRNFSAFIIAGAVVKICISPRSAA